MSLVELRRSTRSEAVSGGAMDRVIERKRIDPRILIAGGAAALLLIILIFWLFAPRSDSVSVTRDRLTIAPVERGVFEDFLPLRARVTPLVTVYLDAVEGGQVQKKLVEDGAQVDQGQLLAVLSNAELQLSTLEKQAEVEQQLNNMRSQELALAQHPQREPARPQSGRDRTRQGAAAVRPLQAARGEGFRVEQDLQRYAATTSTIRPTASPSSSRASPRTRRCKSSQLGQLRRRLLRSTAAWASPATASASSTSARR